MLNNPEPAPGGAGAGAWARKRANIIWRIAVQGLEVDHKQGRKAASY
jgi:hypothetical protein